MALDHALLAQSHSITKLNVASGSQISNRASAIISRLKADNHDQPALVVLTAKAPVANKLISIVEIAKRELPICYQYNALSSATTEIASAPPPSGPAEHAQTGATENNNDDDQESDDDAFETVGAAETAATTTKRNVSIMTIYLSSVPVRDLKIAYG